MKNLLVFAVCTFITVQAAAQSSTNYKIEQGTFNSGGNPSPILTSTSYQMTLDAIGDGINATGLASASYGMDAGFPPDYRPPGEVLNLRSSNATTLTWNPEISAASYNLYRGDRVNLPGNYGTKVQTGLTAPTTTDATSPSSGQCLIYLVTAINRLNEEGPKGYTSWGTLRP